MSGNVIEIPQSKNIAPIWDQQLRVAAYCRVSTGHEEQQNSLKNQIEFYTEYIRRNPYWRFVAVYYDTASGFRMDHRPGYQQLLKDCRRKKIDLILVKSLSRFGRDTVETIKQIRRLKRMNIGVYIETGVLCLLRTIFLETTYASCSGSTPASISNFVFLRIFGAFKASPSLSPTLPMKR